MGAPTVLKASDSSWLAAFGFIAAMYIFLVGSKIVLAFVFSKRKNFVQHPAYVYFIRFLGIILLVYATIFISDAWRIFASS